MILGKYTYQELRYLSLLDEYAWMKPGFESVAVAKPLAGIERVFALVFMGSWCGDTHLQLPLFLRTWRELGGRPASVRFVAADRSKVVRGSTDIYGITRLPTFVLGGHPTDINLELGRIVEKPDRSMREDIIEIVGLLPKKVTPSRG